MAAQETRLQFAALRAIRDTADLCALALAIEQATYESYKELALQMARFGNLEVEKLFRDLADDERQRKLAVEQHVQPGAAKVDADRLVREVLPDLTGKDALTAAGGPYLITPHKAVSLAVRNEQHAFSLFTEVAALAEKPELRLLAETFAKEAFGHLVRLRLARLKTYQREKTQAGLTPTETGEPQAKTSTFDEIAERRAYVASWTLNSLAEAIPKPDGADAAALLRVLAADIIPAGTVGADAAGLPMPSLADRETASLSPQAALAEALRLIETEFAFFSDAADRALDEAQLARAQALAEQMVDRMARIRAQLP